MEMKCTPYTITHKKKLYRLCFLFKGKDVLFHLLCLLIPEVCFWGCAYVIVVVIGNYGSSQFKLVLCMQLKKSPVQF